MDHECFCVCVSACVFVSLYGCLCVAIENLYKVFSVWQVAASSRSGLLCQCRILATVSCFSGEEDYFMTVPIWRGRNKDEYIGQIVSCSIEMCPSASYIFVTFCLELIEISSVSFFPAILLVLPDTEWNDLRICFPDMDTLADWIPLRTLPKGAVIDLKYCQRTLTGTDLGFVCTSWKHILWGKDLAIVFYFYTTPGFFFPLRHF